MPLVLSKRMDMENKQKNPEQQTMRTDLALEAKESITEDNVEIEGVLLKEEYDKDKELKVTTVEIRTQKGAEIMGKPIGTYITIEAPKLRESDENYHKPITKEITKFIKRLSRGIEGKEVLVVGLGNREITPDSLGPGVVDNLFVTRHLVKEFGKSFQHKNRMEIVSAVAPGVMAQTGMETGELINGILKEIKPDLVIVIDALAARSIHRLATTIQITDTGISPGSGVGNNRKALNEESLGVKVIAIGVPTVVDVAAILWDTLTECLDEKQMQLAGTTFYQKVEDKSLMNFFVTPKDIDESVKRISFTISEAINECFFPQ